MPLAFVFLAVVTGMVISVRPATANPQSRALTERAFVAAYNLDHSEAVSLLDQALAHLPAS